MTHQEIRDKFINFFNRNEHRLLPSSSLVPDNDPSVLLTTAGVQQFKSYFAGIKNPQDDFGHTDLISIQKCFRTTDIDEVGDDSHLTFFEMLGNFSIGGYAKQKAIELAWNFVTVEMGLKTADLFVTVFEGQSNIPEDGEAQEIWHRVAPGVEIKKLGREDNFWGPTGVSGPCGPSSEIHIKLSNGESLEIWNLVFTEYIQDENGQLTKLPYTNIDTGMGLERLSIAVNNKTSIFETDLFAPLVAEASKLTLKENPSQKSLRILADHSRAVTFLAADGVVPSNAEQGYLMRRLIRRAIVHGYQIGIEGRFMHLLVKSVVKHFGDAYPYLRENEAEINTVITNEEDKFDRTRQKGLLEFQKVLLRSQDKTISGEESFKLFDTYGFPLPLTKELAEEQGYSVDEAGFEDKFTAHRQVSKSGMEKKFKGGLEDHSARVVRMHTATHLLQQALRDVLGPEIHQRGSNITAERLRFDFNHTEKLNEEQVKEVETIVNDKILKDLKVDRDLMPLTQARDTGALTLPQGEYEDEVSVYSIGPAYELHADSKDQRDRAGYYSREFCGGPHVESTSEVRMFHITGQESIGQGLRRIKAVVE